MSSYEEKKAASARAREKDQEAQKALRKKQEGRNPPKMTREEIKLAKRMKGFPSTEKAERW
jgi:hypothetical protein